MSSQTVAKAAQAGSRVMAVNKVSFLSNALALERSPFALSRLSPLAEDLY
jgi:hypothetical protein